ncbi:MAG: hypothetical protein ACLT76_10520 [Clostridium fessum]
MRKGIIFASGCRRGCRVFLQEHAVQAVVYDQRMKVTGEIQDLAEKYNISYGKAYFLRELIRDNDLTENDMKNLPV